MDRPALKGIPWTAAHDAELRRLHAEGYNAAEIGERLDPPRTKAAVLLRAYIIGQSLATKRPPRGRWAR